MSEKEVCMMGNLIELIFKKYEYKILYKRMLFTCLIVFIYILGSNISIVSQVHTKGHEGSFFKIAISNMGGDVNNLNIFTLGLGPWLTAMIMFSLISYRNMEKSMKQTRAEKNYKEKLLTLFLGFTQGYFIIHEYVSNDRIQTDNILILLIILVTGTMLLVWLADQNIRYGIAGPMPIVFTSIIKSLVHQKFEHIDANLLVLVLIGLIVIFTLFVLLFIELVEYRTNYRDVMNVSQSNTKTYLSWKINPAGSMAIMISISTFVMINALVNLIAKIIFTDAPSRFEWLTFGSPIGITIYILLQMILSYFLSRFLLNTKEKAKIFLKNGNYFISVNPGEETANYLNKMARRVCWFGSVTVTLIIGIPLYTTLLIPSLTQQIYFAIQLIVLIYIGINITETIRTYLYFDRYKQFLNKYW